MSLKHEMEFEGQRQQHEKRYEDRKMQGCARPPSSLQVQYDIGLGQVKVKKINLRHHSMVKSQTP